MSDAMIPPPGAPPLRPLLGAPGLQPTPGIGPSEMGPPPLHVLLRYDADLHTRVLARLNEMIDDSERFIQQRHDDWDRVDKACRLVVDLTAAPRKGDKTTKTWGKENPFLRSFVVPVTYWSLATRQVQKYAVLTSRDPLIHLEGRGGAEDFMGARLHEAILRWDAEQSNLPLVLWQYSWDDERYGFGVIHDTWQEDVGPDGQLALQWHQWEAIDPRNYLPDPARSVGDVKGAVRSGHKFRANWLDLYQGRLEKQQGPYFNINEARKVAQTNPRRSGVGLGSTGSYGDTSTLADYPDLEVARLQVKIIPREWHLSPSENVEVWWFEVVEKKVIVRCHPITNRHGSISYSVGQGVPDGNAPFVPSMGEQLDGIQRISNWCVSSTIENKQRLLNDQIIYDPAFIEELDLIHNLPARHVKLTKRGHELLERGFIQVSGMFAQLLVQDVTQGHLQTSQELMMLAQRVSAANDIIQGVPLPDKRTLGEVQQSNSSGSARIGTAAQNLDRMGVWPSAVRAVANRQQFTTLAQKVRLGGDLVRQMGVDALTVAPTDLRGNYDYIPHTATMAQDPARSSAVWGMIMQTLAGAPALLAPDPMTGKQIDPHAVFNEFIRQNGVRYFDQFYRQAPPMPPLPPPNIVPDDKVEEGVRKGDMVPMAAMGGMR